MEQKFIPNLNKEFPILKNPKFERDDTFLQDIQMLMSSSLHSNSLSDTHMNSHPYNHPSSYPHTPRTVAQNGYTPTCYGVSPHNQPFKDVLPQPAVAHHYEHPTSQISMHQPFIRCDVFEEFIYRNDRTLQTGYPSSPLSLEFSLTPSKERKRSETMNLGFAALRNCIPDVPTDTKLSKIKTLRLAISYIRYLMECLGDYRYRMAFADRDPEKVFNSYYQLTKKSSHVVQSGRKRSNKDKKVSMFISTFGVILRFGLVSCPFGQILFKLYFYHCYIRFRNRFPLY